MTHLYSLLFLHLLIAVNPACKTGDRSVDAPLSPDPILSKNKPPTHAARSLYFEDTDLRGSFVEGTLSIEIPVSMEFVDRFAIYWGKSATEKLDAQPFIKLEKEYASDIHKNIGPVKVPTGATHFIAYTENAHGEMASGTSTPILDKGLPEQTAVSVHFKDTDSKGGHLRGPLESQKLLMKAI